MSYRTWTHAGLWPKPSNTQEHYVYSPNVFDESYWEDWLSPSGQMQDLVAATNRMSPHPTDPDKDDDFILVSDLGGEVRGVNRASFVEALVTNGEKLASYYAQLRVDVCVAWTGTPGLCGQCDSMFLDFGDPGWAACDASGWPNLAGPELLVAADMFTLPHNGSRELYQVPYGGVAGATMEALDWMPPGTTFLAWWHHDSKKNGNDFNGQEMGAGLIWDLAMHGFDSLGAPARDPDNQRFWAAAAAGGARDDGPNIKGIAYYGWGSDIEGPEYMEQSGQYAWQPEWQMIGHWFLSNKGGNPGGADVTTWFSSGTVFVDDEVERPILGQALELSSTASWTGDPAPIDVGQWDQDWIGGSGVWTPLWRPTHQILLRFYLKVLADNCQVDVDFDLDADHALATYTTAATVTSTALAVDPLTGDPEYRVISARAPLPSMSFSTTDMTGMTVAPHVEFSGCQQALFDSPGLFQGLTFIDFPYAYIERSLDVEWTNGDDHDATNEVCGGDGLCINPRTFNAR